MAIKYSMNTTLLKKGGGSFECPPYFVLTADSPFHLQEGVASLDLKKVMKCLNLTSRRRSKLKQGLTIQLTDKELRKIYGHPDWLRLVLAFRLRSLLDATEATRSKRLADETPSLEWFVELSNWIQNRAEQGLLILYTPSQAFQLAQNLFYTQIINGQ